MNILWGVAERGIRGRERREGGIGGRGRERRGRESVREEEL